jgi:hypothetical protein
MLGRLRTDWDQCRVFGFNYGEPEAGAGDFVYRIPLLFKRPLHLPPHQPDGIKAAIMNRTLTADEQREFWAQLFAIVVRYETRKRTTPEVTLELVEDVLQTEPRQL